MIIFNKDTNEERHAKGFCFTCFSCRVPCGKNESAADVIAEQLEIRDAELKKNKAEYEKNKDRLMDEAASIIKEQLDKEVSK